MREFRVGRTEPPDELHDPRPHFVIGVTTFNRQSYLRRFVETFESTKSNAYRWSLLIADDGSSDGTWTYIRSLIPEDYDLYRIRNNGARIAGQTNTILAVADAIGFDFGFKTDDDVYFDKPGWDELYYNAFLESGVGHLVYHNASWKPALHSHTRSTVLRSQTDAVNCMGCFYTFTSQVLDSVGYFDEINFPIRGHSHIDFTMRCCRAGHNNAMTLWDAADSEQYVAMWEREGYVDLTDWNSPEIKKVTDRTERDRRMATINDDERIHVPLTEARAPDHRVAVIADANPDSIDALEATGLFYSPRVVNRDFDAVFVLNLVEDQRKWAETSKQLSSLGIAFRRQPAVFGGAQENLLDWLEYSQKGLTLPPEKAIKRKLIQSPGAWGYLLTFRTLIEYAKAKRYRSILVFDDDVRLHHSFLELYELIRSECGLKPAVVYFGASQRIWENVEYVTEHLYKPNGKVEGSYAVGLSAHVYDALLENIDAFTWPFDSGPLRRTATEFASTSFVAFPNLAIPDVRHSYIRPSRSQTGMAEQGRWNLESYIEREPAEPKRLSPSETITVLIPPLNDPFLLSDTVEAIRLQTYAKLQIFIGVNPDDITLDLAKRLQEEDARVSIFSPVEPRTSLEILNRMLIAADSEFVTVVQPGTISVRERLANALHHVDAGADIVYGSVSVCSAMPSGCRGGTEEQEQWIHSYGTGIRVRVVELLNRQLLDRAGGAVSTGEWSLIEIGSRLSKAGLEISAALAPGTSGISVTSTPFDDSSERWSYLHELIDNGVIPPYVAPTGGATEYHIAKPGNAEVARRTTSFNPM